MTTDGAYVVAEDERGVVDTRADSDYGTGVVDLGWHRDSARVNLRFSGFREERGNGTPLQVNDTTWRQGALTGGGTLGGGAWQAAVSHGSQDYFQTFTAVVADRVQRAADHGADHPQRLHPGLGAVGRDLRDATRTSSAASSRTPRPPSRSSATR